MTIDHRGLSVTPGGRGLLSAQVHQFSLALGALNEAVGPHLLDCDEVISVMHDVSLTQSTGKMPLTDEEVLHFAWRCRRSWPDDADFRAGLAVDRSVMIIVGPRLPWVREVEDEVDVTADDEPPPSLRVETSWEYH